MGPLASPLVRSHVRPLRRGAVTVAGLAAFALVGCGADTTESPATAPAPSSSTSAPPPPADSAAPSSTPSATASSTAGNGAALVAAGKTAVAEVSGSTLVSIETDTDGGTTVWEVQLVNGDGDEQDVDVSADGASVVRTSALDRQDAGDRRENLARVAGAKLDYAAAVDALPSTVAGGTISELKLDTDRGRVVWDAEVRAAGGGEREVTLDAGTGDVIQDR
ncbi:PepSY domain-containing protein [Microlunatus antarcticus]|uniref:Putative membrane protein YkoI n=1 Tax=Microlunatus antarcticus TaxID=53388 RepID=A0A7W5P7W3_9ACTN|nr:PepSY domain-containing protein [Microlunatus antarcticus]MBB3327965.1 putative membrane protein YkoI [Microlunatus antarcticus]